MTTTKKKKTIAKKNNRFNNLAPDQQRVAIAKDVLKQIKMSRFRMRTGTWGNADYSSKRQFPKTFSGAPVFDQLSLNKTTARCVCCAAGAAMLSSIRLFNDCTITGGVGENELEDQLGKFFSKEQIELIEIAFEGSYGFYGQRRHDSSLSDEEYEAAVNFNNKFMEETHEETARAIFQNIVDNKGTFIP